MSVSPLQSTAMTNSDRLNLTHRPWMTVPAWLNFLMPPEPPDPPDLAREFIEPLQLPMCYQRFCLLTITSPPSLSPTSSPPPSTRVSSSPRSDVVKTGLVDFLSACHALCSGLGRDSTPQLSASISALLTAKSSPPPTPSISPTNLANYEWYSKFMGLAHYNSYGLLLNYAYLNSAHLRVIVDLHIRCCFVENVLTSTGLEFYIPVRFWLLKLVRLKFSGFPNPVSVYVVCNISSNERMSKFSGFSNHIPSFL
ncbi:hypothetical protein AALP_AA2G113300 [Arabis alpina]|uniref:Uncharacterized protein n=1 Tax=Arabis alpina TaxID=50452 RepID=A0A087HGQ5_ARAAL|nr:hypothetical protein AALP_AA2G113300 [Arabis alpina]